jgi:hypothetical protein
MVASAAGKQLGNLPKEMRILRRGSVLNDGLLEFEAERKDSPEESVSPEESISPSKHNTNGNCPVNQCKSVAEAQEESQAQIAATIQDSSSDTNSESDIEAEEKNRAALPASATVESNTTERPIDQQSVSDSISEIHLIVPRNVEHDSDGEGSAEDDSSRDDLAETPPGFGMTLLEAMEHSVPALAKKAVSKAGRGAAVGAAPPETNPDRGDEHVAHPDNKEDSEHDDLAKVDSEHDLARNNSKTPTIKSSQPEAEPAAEVVDACPESAVASSDSSDALKTGERERETQRESGEGKTGEGGGGATEAGEDNTREATGEGNNGEHNENTGKYNGEDNGKDNAEDVNGQHSESDTNRESGVAAVCIVPVPATPGDAQDSEGQTLMECTAPVSSAAAADAHEARATSEDNTENLPTATAAGNGVIDDDTNHV